MPQFDLTVFSAQIFWLIVFFSVLMTYTVGVSVPRMRRILDERWQKTDGFKIKADQLKNQAAEVSQATTLATEKARTDAQHLMAIELDKFTQRIQAEKNEILERFQHEFSSHEADIQKSYEDAMKAVEPETIAVTAMVIDRMLGIKAEGDEILNHMNDNMKTAVAT